MPLFDITALAKADLAGHMNNMPKRHDDVDDEVFAIWGKGFVELWVRVAFIE
jgi:hypothetical protein